MELREPRAANSDHPPVAEKLVARLWEEQGPFHYPLTSSDGEEVQVVYRGRRRWDRGPDFPDALIALGAGGLLHGDVEIHTYSSDWRAHGHHRDPFYNRVVLHVVMWDDVPGQTMRHDGARVPVLALSTCLSAPIEQLLAGVSDQPPRPSPCWPGAPDFSSPLGDLLERYGMDRLAARSARFEADLTCASADQLLYGGIAEALGYSQNREPFRTLVGLIPLDALLAYRASVLSTRSSALVDLEALLLGAAGLLPCHAGLPGEGRDSYVAMLRGRWGSDGPTWAGGSMRPAEWQLFRVRPANSPVRRVAALAAIAARWPEEGLAAWLEGAARSLAPRLLPRTMEAFLLRLAPGGYWSRHSGFGLPLARPLDLVGRHRAAEVAVNVFLPFLAARAVALEDGDLALRVREAYRLYPKRGDNEITRYMAAQITAIPRPPVARSACRQQGLLYLYRSRCERKRCGECPVQALDSYLSPIAI